MHFPLFTRCLPILALTLLTSIPLAWGATDRTFTTSPTQAVEIRYLVRLLEEIHYNRDAIKPADYAEVIPDFMKQLDGQRLFFTEKDRTQFEEAYPADSLYWNINSLGRIDPAYEIFKVYEKQATQRITWIFGELDRELDLTTYETYVVDRSKLSWPVDEAQADDLWRKRLKFEILQEVLNKKTPEEARDTVRKRYERMLKNLADIEGSELAEMFLTSIAELYDPHSTYFSPETFEDFSINMRLQLFGIGALLGIEEDVCVIKEIIPGGPADLGKEIKPNDKIIAVAQGQGEPVEIIGMKLRKIVDMIRGPKGTEVRLVIEPADATDTSIRREILITRDVVNLDSQRAHAAVFEVPDPEGAISKIGVISLPAFYGPDSSANGQEQHSASQDVAELIKRLKPTGIQGLVLDLRGNGGGLLSEAIDLAGLFIKTGPVVQVRSYYGDINIDDDKDPSVAYDGPLAVLVDRFSASASEIVAGALQNYGRAVVIGDSSTHGKGSVQTVFEMKNVVPMLARAPAKTGATKLTVQKFYLPNGASTQLKGVVPDIVLPSVDDFLPIGESDLPHALVWDEIPSSFFDGKPLSEALVAPLREASETRQESLDEFAYLRRGIDWFRAKQETKEVSLNLLAREKQREIDAAFKKERETERERLAQNDFKFTEIMLAPPPPPRIKAKPDPDANLDEPLQMSTDENERYSKVDIPLREALRVLNDARAINPDPAMWTAQSLVPAYTAPKEGS